MRRYSITPTLKHQMTLFRPSPVAKSIIESLETNPDKWRCDASVLSFGEYEDVSFWIRQGMAGLRVRTPSYVELDLFERIRIWRAFRRWWARGRRQRKEVAGQPLIDKLTQTQAPEGPIL